MRCLPAFIFFCCLSLLCQSSFAQQENDDFKNAVEKNITVDTAAIVIIDSIIITGNKKTKTYIILREMQLKAGDSIAYGQLQKILQQSHDLIYNTTLVSEVVVTTNFTTPANVKVNVAVKEKWYIYPTPQFQLVDRNFNEWIKVYNASLSRVIYGAKFIHYNFSGRRDQIRMYLLNGYARNISFGYSAPYSNAALNEGFGVGASFTQNREIAYRTSYNNKLLQYNNKDFVRNVFSLSASYFVRKGYFKRHAYSIGYTLLNVRDSLLKFYNPNYYGSDKAHKGYTDLTYSFQYTKTNNINYPLTGKIYGGSVLKRGLEFKGGVNMLQIDAFYNRYIEHKKNWYSTFEVSGRIKAPFEQSYLNQRALGFGGFYLRGLEYYVIDGVAAALAKYTLRKKLIAFSIPTPIKNKLFTKIPFAIYGKGYADAGYSYSKPPYTSMLNNKMLYTGGFGIDILTLYDINLKVEYSFNQLNEKGLFLHARGGF